MPRIKLKSRKYAKEDYRAWIRAQMKEQKLTNEVMGLMIGVSGQQFSRKLKAMDFSYDQLVLLNERLKCPTEKVVYFMTGSTVKEVWI